MIKISNIINKDNKREIAFTGATLAFSTVVTSLGAAHFLGDKFPAPLEKLKEFVAKHIVEPHLDMFENRFNRQLHSADVSEHKHEQRLEIPYQGLSRSERIERISTIIVKEGTVFVAEGILGTALQYALRNVSKVKVDPGKIVFADAAVQLGAMALTAVPPISKPASWAYHKMAEILPKITGMDKKKAKDFARHVTYVGAPGFLGFVAGLVVAGRKDISHER